MNSKVLNNKIFIYFFFTITAFLTRYYLFEGRESWHDEWHTIYVAEPFVSTAETLSRYYGDKGGPFLTEFYPHIYLFILKFFFQFFGYVDENGRYLSLIVGTLTVPLTIYLTTFFIDIKKVFFTGIVVTLNLFLIWQSLEIRAHSILVFSSLINIILFYKLLENKNYFNLFSYAAVSIFLLSLWPISGAIFFGKTIYITKKLIFEKVVEKKIFILFVFILLAYIILNIDYLKLNLSRDFHYTSLYESFFYNYHFRSFFGSKILGGCFLIIFSFLLIKNLKKIIFLNTKENIIIYIILSSYFLTLVYTFLRASIMSPKYVIFILPLIIIWISVELVKINKIKIIKLFLGFLTLFFFFTEINNYPIKRPPTSEALKIIKNDNAKYIVTIESPVFNKYLTTKKIFIKENFVLIDKKQNVNSFWFICLNNPRYEVGGEKLKDQEKCKSYISDNKFVETKEIKIKDFILKKFKIEK
tara:strand:+ start:6577 stop:7989 length:1413 start_codon:yes stop_codon:yes gene_type:complete